MYFFAEKGDLTFKHLLDLKKRSNNHLNLEGIALSQLENFVRCITVIATFFFKFHSGSYLFNLYF